MRGHQQRASCAVTQRERDDFLLRSLVKAGERLVKHHQVAGKRHGPRKRHAPPHATGQLHGRLVQAIGRQNFGQQVAHVGAACARRQHQRHVLHGRQRFAQAVFLEHHAYATWGNAANLPRIGALKAQQHPEQRRLATARRRHEAAHAAARQCERRAPQHLIGPVRLANPIELHVRERPKQRHATRLASRSARRAGGSHASAAP